MPQGKYFRIGYALIIILLIIYLSTLVDFIFRPIAVLIQTLFAPIILAGVLYYLFRPFVNLLAKKMPRSLAILLLYIIVAAVLTFLFLLVGPELQKQLNSFMKNIPHLMNEIRTLINNLQQNEYLSRFQLNENFSFEQISSELTTTINNVLSTIGTNLASFIGFITNAVLIVIIIPFVLFYMLKEGEKAPAQFLRLLPKKQQEDARRILGDMDKALSSYIQGQIIVSFCVGVLAYIAFLIIKLDYPLVLALVAMFTNVIPFIGPWIGTIPAVVVGLIHSPFMALLVILVIIVIQQIESNLISPQVMGRKLAIHPLTIILLILAAGRFAGLLGLILAVPTYAVLKVIVSHIYRLWNLRKIQSD
ncbi:AI-2E family transporter [Alkalihalobacillus sp. LMS39]|uniref:AI-2E family transporter n=1 Tax=Alkalihalobacillus sp. LMS39 TaxID=2924032 RepID=UPI001FB442A4|nr:AI-2E family transporter [Alkalihalobacillus sp. LMS39]UOE93227.1 AI-2E family transporter [Alkalihalobacillus sp. LMS39]